jgi:hypothetical protein
MCRHSVDGISREIRVKVMVRVRCCQILYICTYHQSHLMADSIIDSNVHVAAAIQQCHLPMRLLVVSGVQMANVGCELLGRSHSGRCFPKPVFLNNV